MDSFVSFANELADIARATLASLAGESIQPVFKENSTPVTEHDKAVEQALRDRIAVKFPDHGVFGEELGVSNIGAEYVWVLDPIDGTASFIAGLPNFSTLIALCHRGNPVLGLIDNVSTQCRWVGGDGIGSSLNGAPLKTRACPNLANAIAVTYSPELFRANERDGLAKIVSITKLTVYGGSSLAYGRLAGGFIDLGIEAQHDATDYCALVAIISNAGGIVSDWEGRPLTLSSGDRFLAAGDPSVHAEVCTLLSDAGISERARS